MDSGDIAATILSTLALLVSGWTLYLTYFRKKAALIGCLAAVSVPAPDQVEDCVFDFALSNNGNLELLVREVSLDFDDGEDGLIPEISAALPIVLKPGGGAPASCKNSKHVLWERGSISAEFDR